MKSLSSLFIWWLPLGLLAVESLAALFIEWVNAYRLEKRERRLRAVQSQLSAPWSSEPVTLKSLEDFVREAIRVLRPLQCEQRLKHLKGKETCGS